MGASTSLTVDGWTTSTRSWAQALLGHEEFRSRVIERWRELRAGSWAEDVVLGRYDDARAEVEAAMERTEARWGCLAENGTIANPEAFPVTVTGEMDRLRAWIELRGRWLDDHIDELPGS